MKKQFIEIMKFRPRDFVFITIFAFIAIMNGAEVNPLAVWIFGGSAISLAIIFFAVRKL